MAFSPETLYNQQIKKYQSELKQLERNFFFLYLFRLFLFIGFISFIIWFALSPNQWYLPFLSGICLISFLYVVKKDLSLVKQQQLLQKRLDVNQNELDYLSHQYNKFKEGTDFQRLNPHLAGDFDLFGTGSLFQYLNRSVTVKGTNRFAEKLCTPNLEKDKIVQYQKCIEELSGKADFMEDFQSRGMLLSENGMEQDNLMTWLSEPDNNLKHIKPLLIIYPLLLAILVFCTATGFVPVNILWFPVLFSFFVVSRKKKILDHDHNMLGRNAKTFEKYSTLINSITREDFKTPYCHKLSMRFFVDDTPAGYSLKQLFRLLKKFDYRYNLIISILFNILFLFDLQIYYRLQIWKKRHKQIVSGWFDSLAEFDALMGFARFSYNNKGMVSYPEVSDEPFCFEAKSMGHPLIPDEIRVCNDICFKGQPRAIVVTGANMAGKSTFLRTVAINLILAMNGAPACAKSFCFSPCWIMSSINVHDSLSQHASYFYAELLRIREIIDHVTDQPKTLVILDEILRGTNTKDKQTGSIGLLEKMIKLNSIVIIATHDLTIGELDKAYPDIVTNYCFEVELEDEQLIFDYKLKNGISKKLNASFLMQKIGII